MKNIPVSLLSLTLSLLLIFSPLSTQASFDRPLFLGTSGEDVSLLQRLLQQQGFFNYPSITGIFGPVTETALQAFQKANHIVTAGTPETTGFGRLGPATRAVLNALLPANTPASASLLAQVVYRIQQLLSLPATGVLDQATLLAISSYGQNNSSQATTTKRVGRGGGGGGNSGGSSPEPEDDWWEEGALIDMDFESNQFFYDDDEYTDESAFLTAIGAVASGSAYIIEPKVVGDELLADPHFDNGVTGWAMGLTYEASGTIAWDSTNKLMIVDVPSRSTSSVQVRYGIGASTTISKAYQYQMRWVGGYELGSGGWNMNFAPNNLFGGQFEPLQNISLPNDSLVSGIAGANAATMYIGPTTNTSTTTDDAWDDASVKEVLPLEYYNYAAVSGIISGVTPDSVPGATTTILQGDTNRQNFRLSLVWDNSSHLRLIAVAQNIEQANLDLGTVATSTAFTVRFSSTANSFKANLNGGSLVTDTSGQHPAIAYIRIGKSFIGEDWTGEVSRVTLFPDVMSDADFVDPELSFMIFGDSTANGDGNGGATTTWHYVLRNSYAPARSVAEAAQGGENSTQMLARVAADTDHREWTTIFMDLPNTGEDASTYIQNVKDSVAYLDTDRWFVMPPAQNSPGGTPLNSSSTVATIQSALLSDSFFSGHTFSSTTQAAYLADVNDDDMRSDYTHFNAAGAAVQASYIKDFLDLMGW